MGNEREVLIEELPSRGKSIATVRGDPGQVDREGLLLDFDLSVNRGRAVLAEEEVQRDFGERDIFELGETLNDDLRIGDGDLRDARREPGVEVLGETFGCFSVVLFGVVKFAGSLGADPEIAKAQSSFSFDREVEAEALGVGCERMISLGESNAMRGPGFAVAEGLGPADIFALERLAGDDGEAGNFAETEVIEFENEGLFWQGGFTVGVERNPARDLKFVGSVFE